MDWDDNYVCLHGNHLEQHDDFIIIYFYDSKGFQEGMNREYLWHIYLNRLPPDFPP